MQLSLSTILMATVLSYIAPGVFADVPLFGQCGGIGYTGPTKCVAGTYCYSVNPYYSACFPVGVPVTTGSAVQVEPPASVTAIAA